MVSRSDQGWLLIETLSRKHLRNTRLNNQFDRPRISRLPFWRGLERYPDLVPAACWASRRTRTEPTCDLRLGVNTARRLEEAGGEDLDLQCHLCDPRSQRPRQPASRPRRI